jgi:hypothetical protein
MASISITKKINQTSDDRFRLRAWVSSTSDNIPSEIFLHGRAAPVPMRPTDEDIFKRVCLYADIFNYPAEPSTENPFHRRPGVDVLFTSLSSLDTFFQETLVAGAEAFLNDIAAIHTAVAAEAEIVYG